MPWVCQSAFAEGGPEGGFGADHRLDGDPWCFRDRCNSACRSIPFTERGPEGGGAGNHRLNNCCTTLAGAVLAAAQLHGHRRDDEGSQKTGGQGDRAAAGRDKAVGQD